MGHYNEKIVKLTVNMQELTQHQTITYEMIMDAQNSSWERCLKHNLSGNMFGPAEFSQY